MKERKEERKKISKKLLACLLLLLLLLWKRGRDKSEKESRRRRRKRQKDKRRKMGAKASTNGNQSPRTFSNSSSSDVVSAGNNPTSFNFLRAMHGVEVANDSRQRARSMSSVPDMQSAGTNHHHHHHPNAYSNHPTHNSQPYSHVVDVNGFQNSGAGSGPHFDLSSVSSEERGNHEDNNSMLQGINSLGLGRVYTAASLPSHIWSINGKCQNFLLLLILLLITFIWMNVRNWIHSPSRAVVELSDNECPYSFQCHNISSSFELFYVSVKRIKYLQHLKHDWTSGNQMYVVSWLSMVGSVQWRQSKLQIKHVIVLRSLAFYFQLNRWGVVKFSVQVMWTSRQSNIWMKQIVSNNLWFIVGENISLVCGWLKIQLNPLRRDVNFLVHVSCTRR